ncbi:MAG: AAA family ATPase, partial [Kiritimatiellae bacterium]|nr:AAA family ATPase [Kiritimatiellia bacterium]
MLTTLRIKNLAIVENVRVEFLDGLNVITGETGAGKSILIGALTLVLGGRADKNMIRTGEDKCGVEASFALKEVAPINFLLDDLGIDLCEGGQLIVQRIISESGSGKNLINGCSATVQMLKKLGNLLVDMHGPHDHQSLLSREFQLEMLDSFAQLAEVNQKYKHSYREMLDIAAELKELDGDDSQVAQQIDLLSYQVAEIDDAKLSEDDEDDLGQEHARVANAQRIIELSATVYNAISEDEYSAFNAMVGAQGALTELSSIIDDA